MQPLKNRSSISFKTQLLKYTAALLLCSCLLFLTGINFIIYGSHTLSSIVIESAKENASDKTSTEKPPEDKSSPSSVNLQEEYVDEISLVNSGLTLADDPRQYRLLDDARLTVVHFELLSPPPNL